MEKYELLGRLSEMIALDRADAAPLTVRHYLAVLMSTNLLALNNVITPELQKEINEHFRKQVRTQLPGQLEDVERFTELLG